LINKDIFNVRYYFLLGFYYNDNTIRNNEKIQGYKNSILIESGLGIGGFFQKILTSFTNYNNISLELMNKQILLTLVSHCKFGLNLGFLPFYDAFLLGGSNSLRGYQDGELGVCRNFLENSIEVRINIDKNIKQLYLFLDYCSKLNSSNKIIYNNQSSESLKNQGSSLGIGFLVGSNRIEYGINLSNNKKFLNFNYGERY
jgi:outer membrane protein insertion porin family